VYVEAGHSIGVLGALGGLATITGQAQYFSGEVTKSWRDYHTGGTECKNCAPDVESNPEKYRTLPMRDKFRGTERLDWCRCQILDTNSDTRPGVMMGPGDAGWAVYVPNLIAVGGGGLPGWARLQGSIPADLQNGQTVTLQGDWVGTPPNNLCGNCGWDFQVSGQAAAGTEGATGSLDPNAPEMVEARLEVQRKTAEEEALEEGSTPEEAAAIADLEVERERELIRTGYPMPESPGSDLVLSETDNGNGAVPVATGPWKALEGLSDTQKAMGAGALLFLFLRRRR